MSSNQSSFLKQLLIYQIMISHSNNPTRNQILQKIGVVKKTNHFNLESKAEEIEVMEQRFQMALLKI